MIKGTARAVVKAEHREAFLALAREFMAKTRAEKGNISYKLYVSVADPNILTFFEEWESPEALDSHLNSEHFLRIAPLFAQMQAGPTMVDTYTDTNL